MSDIKLLKEKNMCMCVCIYVSMYGLTYGYSGALTNAKKRFY